jgi:hypothetical protein
MKDLPARSRDFFLPPFQGFRPPLLSFPTDIEKFQTWGVDNEIWFARLAAVGSEKGIPPKQERLVVDREPALTTRSLCS